MAHFYATIKGSRNTTLTKTGTKNSGMTAHIRGWDVGAEIVLTHEGNNQDLVRIYKTGGSSGASSRTLVAEYFQDEPKKDLYETKYPKS